MLPSASSHWQRAWSRSITAFFTFAGTEAFRFSCWASRSLSPSISTCSSVAPGMRCDSPALAFLSSARNSRDTVRWMRLAVAVIGSTVVRAATRSPG